MEALLPAQLHGGNVGDVGQHIVGVDSRAGPVKLTAASKAGGRAEDREEDVILHIISDFTATDIKYL